MTELALIYVFKRLAAFIAIKQATSSYPLSYHLIDPITSNSRIHELLLLTISLFLLIISRLRFYRESYLYEFFR